MATVVPDLKRELGVPVVAPGHARVEHHSIDVEGLALRISIAPPLNSSGPPAAILYILDPDPELFPLAAVHIFGRAGFDDDASPSASVLRCIAVVGVGHHPRSFSATSVGWDVAALRELRRRDFLRNDPGSFLHALCTVVVPQVERHLGCQVDLPSGRRGLLGCSLSSLFALRVPFSHPCLFGKFILGSPSLPLAARYADDLNILQQRWLKSIREPAASGAPSSQLDLAVLFVAGEAEGFAEQDESGNRGNGIPQAAQRLAVELRSCGVDVGDVVLIAGEDHGSVKPSLVSQGLGWLERSWAR